MPDPSPAATVILLRPTEPSFDVLLVERNGRGFFGDLAVFPGGGVEPADAPSGVGISDDLSHRRAALRELAEETGILLTPDGPMAAPRVRGPGFYEEVAEDLLMEASARLTLVSRWVTPENVPRRFDARFYLAVCESPPAVTIDEAELVGHRWVRPEHALEMHRSGQLRMLLPTLAHLRWLSKRDSVESAIESARGADGRTLIRPRVEQDGSLLPIHMPAEMS